MSLFNCCEGSCIPANANSCNRAVQRGGIQEIILADCASDIYDQTTFSNLDLWNAAVAAGTVRLVGTGVGEITEGTANAITTSGCLPDEEISRSKAATFTIQRVDKANQTDADVVNWMNTHPGHRVFFRLCEDYVDPATGNVYGQYRMALGVVASGTDVIGNNRATTNMNYPINFAWFEDAGTLPKLMRDLNNEAYAIVLDAQETACVTP